MVVKTSARPLLFAACCTLAFFVLPMDPAAAGPLYRIDSIVHGTTGGFAHSLFHSARNITNGQRLAYFDLSDEAGPHFYNAATGEIRFGGDLFSDRQLTDKIGTFSATSTNLMGDDLSDNVWDDDLAGSITFELNFEESSNAFFSYMAAETGSSSGTHFSTINFVDRQYGGIEPLFANSLDLDAGLLTLWGADGAVSGAGNFSTSILGADIVLSLVTAPEPTSIALWALAGSACVTAVRRRRRRA